MTPQPVPPSPSTLIPHRTRVRDPDGFVGTVLYVGPVASAKNPSEIYAGIAWDDDTRGKHDGSVVSRKTNEIVRHFSCGPTQGSFLRLSKVDVGVPLDGKLLRSKYVSQDAPVVAPNNVLPHVARTSSGRDKPIELHGELKIRKRQQPDQLDGVALRCLGIACVRSSSFSSSYEDEENEGGGESLEEFAHLRRMDLAGNLLSGWDDALDILRRFPNLEDFSLASNRIRDVPSPSPSSVGVGRLEGFGPGSFARMKVLNLNRCGIATFDTLLAVGKAMPNLEELCAAHGDLSDMGSCGLEESRGSEEEMEGEEKEESDGGGNEAPAPLPEGAFEKVALLDLSDCKLASWNGQVRRLRSLPALESLVLNDNAILRVDGPSLPRSGNEDGEDAGDSEPHLEPEPQPEEFPALTSLQLAGNSLSIWTDLDSLNSLPSLRSLRFRSNPLTSQMGAAEARSLVLARLGNLGFLNGSTVSERERTEAERRYVSSVAREMLHAASVAEGESPHRNGSDGTATEEEEAERRKAEVLEGHPRFPSLASKHKSSMLSSSGRASTGGGAIGTDAVNVTIRSMAPSSCTVEPLRRRLPGGLTVGRLKSACARAFDVPPERQVMHHRNPSDGGGGGGGEGVPTEMDDDERTLAYFGVMDGAEILVNEVDEDGEEKRRSEEEQEKKRRMEIQERRAGAMGEARRREERAGVAGAAAASGLS